MVFQIQITRRQDVVPRTREYIGAREEMLRRREQPVVVSPRRQTA
jgi:hypothetical protein